MFDTAIIMPHTYILSSSFNLVAHVRNYFINLLKFISLSKWKHQTYKYHLLAYTHRSCIVNMICTANSRLSGVTTCGRCLFIEGHNSEWYLDIGLSLTNTECTSESVEKKGLFESQLWLNFFFGEFCWSIFLFNGFMVN